MDIKNLIALLTALLMVAIMNFFFTTDTPSPEVTPVSEETVTLQGTGEVLGMDGETMQPTAASLVMDLNNGKATVELTTETMGMNFYLLASEMNEDPNLAMLYMMCSVVGEGQITEAADGYQVSFAWEVESMDEATGKTSVIPMTLDIAVKCTDGVYTATLDYLGVVVEISSEIA